MIDVFGSYRINKVISLRGGVDNLFDFDPNVVGKTPGTTDAVGVTNPQYYDVLGRRYFLGVQADF
jgi:iron complex outermembrane recepter protein